LSGFKKLVGYKKNLKIYASLIVKQKAARLKKCVQYFQQCNFRIHQNISRRARREEENAEKNNCRNIQKPFIDNTDLYF
jgi:hypothetical protein